MYRLIVGDEASDDLERLIEENEVAGLRLFALLEELEESQDLMDRMTQDGYGGSPKHPKPGAVVNIGKWIRAQQQGMNIWRMRDFELSRKGYEYRMIYAFNPKEDLYFILGIVERAFDYDERHPITQRIYATYRRLEEDEWY